MAQRMESVAPPGGVMVGESTARLVDGAAALGEPELFGSRVPTSLCAARRLLGIEDHAPSSVLSRIWWVGDGRCPPLKACWSVRSTAMARWSAWQGHLASGRAVWCVKSLRWRRPGVDVFTAFCESHASQIPFHVVTRLLRAAFGLGDLDAQAARDRVHARLPDADPEDLALFDDLLGIADPMRPLPTIDPDARRRRLTALVNAASLTRKPRRSTSLRTCIGSMASASRCWPTCLW